MMSLYERRRGAGLTDPARFLGVLAALGGSLLVTAVVFAQTGIPGWIPPGVLPALGVPSPLSGMTRSFVALASGDLPGAFGWHPLGPVVFAACVGAVVLAGVSTVRGAVPEGVRALASKRPVWLLVGWCFVVAWIRQIVYLGS